MAKKLANGPSPMDFKKYRAYQDCPEFAMSFDNKWKERKWPAERITQAPRWCSVDLRDGNQALANPMNADKKHRFFMHLVKLGYKEIEVGFPAASQTDFDFCRHIIEDKLIPDDVHIQVLTQCREPLIKRTIEAVTGAKNVILHVYNSTSELQRRVVFEKSRDEIKALAVEGVTLAKKMAQESLIPTGSSVRYEYSPESFTGTELDYSLEVCEAVIDILAPNPGEQVIINLPATVEMASPNVYADQIEWMHTHFKNREKVILSLHPHNDRGCGIACAELGQMAGADRVEGCLFGNGERTGNVCLVALGMNLFSQGIDPEIDFRNIQESIDVAEYCNELKVPERHPWAGHLVYTAFSGSHQDAIKKGMARMKGDAPLWEVPYLPIDPSHIGRNYEAIIRVNSQSGKGGIAYLLEQDYGIALPKACQMEFSSVVQEITDKTSAEVTPATIFDAFNKHYCQQENGLQLIDFDVSTKLVALDELDKQGITEVPKDLQIELVGLCKPLKDRAGCHQVFKTNFLELKTPIELVEYEETASKEKGDVTISATLKIDGKSKVVEGTGNGPISAYLQALNSVYGELQLKTYEQHTMKQDVSSDAICYISIARSEGRPAHGVGINTNTTHASLMAVTVAANRALDTTAASEAPADAFESLCSISAHIQYKGTKTAVLGSGNGPVAAFVSAVRTYYAEAKDLALIDYSQTARGASKTGHNSEAVCSIACSLGGGKKKKFGVGLDVNTNTASAKAVLSSLTLLLR